jgi:hypothetical protein
VAYGFVRVTQGVLIYGFGEQSFCLF